MLTEFLSKNLIKLSGRRKINLRIAQEEVFGSVFSIIKFRDEEADANDIRFGLALSSNQLLEILL